MTRFELYSHLALFAQITHCRFRSHLLPPQTELIDVLRKRRSRPDSFENNLDTVAALLSPKRSSAEMYDLRNTLPSRKALDPDAAAVAAAVAQVRLSGVDMADHMAPLSAIHGNHLKMMQQLSSSSSTSKGN